MDNQKTDIINDKPGKDKVMPMSLNTISAPVVEARRPMQSLMTIEGILPFSSIMDVPVTLVFEVGRTTINIKQLMELNKGSFIEMRQVSVDTIDIRINDKLFGYGETIALQSRYGIRFGELEIIAGVDDADE